MQAATMHDQATPAASTDPCRLLSLPPELRNRIYECVLRERASGRFIALSKDVDPDYDAQSDNLKLPALLQTNSQIRQEAMGIFYRLHKFYFTAHDSLAPVLPCSLGYVMNGTAMLRYFQIVIPGSYCYGVGFRPATHERPWRVRMECGTDRVRRDDCDCVGEEIEEGQPICEYCLLKKIFPAYQKRIRRMLSSQRPLTAEVLCKLIEEVVTMGNEIIDYYEEDEYGVLHGR